MDYKKHLSENDRNQIEISQKIIDDAKSKIQKIIKVMNSNNDDCEIVKHCNMYLSDMLNSIKCHSEIIERFEHNSKRLFIMELSKA